MSNVKTSWEWFKKHYSKSFKKYKDSFFKRYKAKPSSGQIHEIFQKFCQDNFN